jgi:hypothetical protein
VKYQEHGVKPLSFYWKASRNNETLVGRGRKGWLEEAEETSWKDRMRNDDGMKTE